MNNKDNHYNLLAFSFSQGFISPNIPIATFHQGDIELNFIIDTGSDNNVIDCSILDKVEHTKTSNTTTLTGLGGTQTVSSCIISFNNNDEKFSAEFLISDLKEAFGQIKACHAIPLHGMLGSRFLMKNNIVLDFNSLTAYSKNDNKR